MSALDNKTSQNQDDLARQWIDFLRKRNTLLSILWPLFLILAVVAVIAAFYFQQSSLTSEVEKKLLANEKHELVVQLENSQIKVVNLEENVQSLSNEVNSLRDKLTQGDAEVKNGNEKAVFDAQLISNLESQVALLKTENSALTEALEESKALVELHKGTLAKKQGLKDDLLKENAELLSKLESRKIAYTALSKRLKETQSEVERLASINLSQERQLRKSGLALSEKKAQYLDSEKQLVKLNSEIDQLREQNTNLSNQLQSVLSPVGVSPIAGSKKFSGESSDVRNQINKNSEVTNLKASKPINSLVFEEIKAVKPE